MEYLTDAIKIAEAVLAIIGGFKLISRYTPWKWDDKVCDAAEKPVKVIVSFFKPKA